MKTVTYKFKDDKDWEDFVKIVVRQETDNLEEANIESETDDSIVVVFDKFPESEE